MAVEVSAGQDHETRHFEQPLLAVRIPQPGRHPRHRPNRLAGDKGYSYKRVRDWLARHKIQAVIPTRKDQHPEESFDKQAYRRRNVIERLVGWLKESRAVATRFEKLAVNYKAMVQLAMIGRYLRMLGSSDRA